MPFSKAAASQREEDKAIAEAEKADKAKFKEEAEAKEKKDAEEAAERFDFGDSRIYEDLQSLIAATDFGHIKNVLLKTYLMD